MKKVLSIIVVLLFAVVVFAPRSYAPTTENVDKVQANQVDFKDVAGPDISLPYGPVNP